MNATHSPGLELIDAENALRSVTEARQLLVARYLDLDPSDSGYEVAVAETPVPADLANLSAALHAAAENLMNAISRIKGEF